VTSKRRISGGQPPHILTEEERLPLHPSWVLLGFFVALIAVGALLLSSPRALAEGESVPFLDALFTAASAGTGTGLVVRDTASFWSPFGQQVILALFQLGGLGTLVGSTIFLLVIARRVSQEERFLLKESTGVTSVAGILFLIIGITLYVVAVELVGSYLLAPHLPASVPEQDVGWLSFFHAASSFNNAGFAVMDLAKQPPDPSVQLILGVLGLLGSLSFIIVIDLLTGVFRRTLALDTKLVLAISALLLAGGAGLILLTEWDNPATLGSLPPAQKALSAFFHSASSRTAGFATTDISAFAQPALLAIIALMFIGGASGSTAGGVKVNTFGVAIAVTWSFLRGRREVSILGSTVHEEQVYRALAIGFISLLLVFGFTIALSVTEGADLLGQLFEVVSAFSTTGFSLDVTPQLSAAGKVITVCAMLVGRIGPLTLAFVLSQRHRPTRQTYRLEAVNLG